MKEEKMDKYVRYWKREEEKRYLPIGCSKREVKEHCKRTGDRWCENCKAVIEPVQKLDTTGLVDICPFCGIEV
jgi:hypothetical protein